MDRAPRIGVLGPVDASEIGRYSLSLARGLSILACFEEERAVRGIADMAEELGMLRSSTHRYSTTLVALGYLERDSTRRYRLAARAGDIGLAAVAALSVRVSAAGALAELRDRTGYTASLAVLEGSDVVCVDRRVGHRAGQYAVDQGLGIGSRFPAVATAAGRALLAARPEQELRELLASQPAKLRGRGQGLRAELDRVHLSGVAVSKEPARGRYAAAVAVSDADGGLLAAVELALPAALRTAGLTDRLARELETSAQQIAELVGDEQHG